MNGDKLLLDTNTVLNLLNGDETLADLLNNKDLYLSFISEIELLGYHKITSKETQLIKAFIKECFVIDVNTEIKNKTISIRSKYGIKLGDSLIAATSLYLGFPLVTSDKGFNKIKELDLILYQK
jgi:hypothetical protein